MIEYGWPLAAPRTLAERIAEMTEAARYLHGDLLDLTADLDAVEVEVEPSPDATRSVMRPIDLADVRKGDRVHIITEGTVKDVDACGWVMEPDSCAESWYLLDRPDPEAELHAAIADALSGALDDNGETTCDWSAEAPAFVAALAAAGYVIEPAPKEVDRA